MAGRGTDIILGGNPNFLCGPKTKQDTEETYQNRLKKFQGLCQKEKEEVLKAGGLFIIGTERHEARRIDNQLRGRSGRQGDPGASKFYLSLEDDLMRVFGGERMQKVMTTLRMEEEAPITDRLLTRAIANAQKKVEGHNFEIRKHLLEYDNVMNQQRTAVYKMRKEVMTGKELERQFLDRLADVVSDKLDRTASEELRKEQWNIKSLQSFLNRAFDLEIMFPPIESLTLEHINSKVQEAVRDRFESKKQEFKEHFEPLIQFLLLQTIDARWREHLENVDHLREGINLRAFAQKDPLVEYKKETFHLFESLNLTVASEVIEKFFKIQLSSSVELKQKNQTGEQLIYSERAEENMAFSAPQHKPGPQRDRQLNRRERRQQAKALKKQRIKI